MSQNTNTHTNLSAKHKCRKNESMPCASSGHPIVLLHLARHGGVNIVCGTGTHRIQTKWKLAFLLLDIWDGVFSFGNDIFGTFIFCVCFAIWVCVIGTYEADCIAGCISLILCIVLLLCYNLYFSDSVNCISQIISKIKTWQFWTAVYTNDN